MSELKSGDEIPTLAGNKVKLPFRDEHPCFGQRQGWCSNKAVWRHNSEFALLHWCDECRNRSNVKSMGGEWQKMEPRPDAFPT